MWISDIYKMFIFSFKIALFSHMFNSKNNILIFYVWVGHSLNYTWTVNNIFSIQKFMKSFCFCHHCISHISRNLTRQKQYGVAGAAEVPACLSIFSLFFDHIPFTKMKMKKISTKKKHFLSSKIKNRYLGLKHIQRGASNSFSKSSNEVHTCRVIFEKSEIPNRRQVLAAWVRRLQLFSLIKKIIATWWITVIWAFQNFFPIQKICRIKKVTSF